MLYCSFYACNVPSLYFLCPLTHCCSSSDLPGFLPAEKMLMAIKSAYSASLSCSSFIPFENSKMGLMNSNCRPATNRREQGEAVKNWLPSLPLPFMEKLARNRLQYTREWGGQTGRDKPLHYAPMNLPFTSTTGEHQ